MYNRYENFPRRHVAITPHDTNKVAAVMIIYCGSDGDITVKDDVGTEITYTVVAGSYLPIMPEIVMATGTTVDPVIGLI